mmetsp:Transcript_22001/g.46818  ORF Transcript_22001/g.46818 Transcript_22001/m.46818 type:complete len:221 (-) Transcript_22001:206-868(-)
MSWNICARSPILRSSCRMSWCFSRIRWTSSKRRACVPAIFLATMREVVSPSSIIWALSSSVASGMRISISRACRLSSACLKSTCAFWKSTRSCWCFLAMAWCMLVRIFTSAELGFRFASSSDFTFRRSRPSLTTVMCSLVSWTKCCSLSDTVFSVSCVVACSASSKTPPISFTFARPLLRVLCNSLTVSKNSRMNPSLPATCLLVAAAALSRVPVKDLEG